MASEVFEPAQLADDVRADLRQSHLPLGVWSEEKWPPQSAHREQYGSSAELAIGQAPEKPFQPDLYGSKVVIGSTDEKPEPINSVARATYVTPSGNMGPPTAFDPSLQSSHIFRATDLTDTEPLKSVHRESFTTFDEKDARPSAYDPHLHTSHILNLKDATETETPNSVSRATYLPPPPENLRIVRAKEPDYIRQQSAVARDVEKAEFRSTYDELGPGQGFVPSDNPAFRDIQGERDQKRRERAKVGYVDPNWAKTVELGDDSIGIDYTTVSRQDFASVKTEKPLPRATVPEELYGGSQFKLGDTPIEFETVSRSGYQTCEPGAVKESRQLAPAGQRCGGHSVTTAELQRSHFQFGSDSHDLSTVSRDSFKQRDGKEARQKQAIATYAHLDAVLKVEDADSGGEWTTDYRARIGQGGQVKVERNKPTISLNEHRFELGIDDVPIQSETRGALKDTADRVAEIRGKKTGDTRDGIVPNQARETYDHLIDHVSVFDVGGDDDRWKSTSTDYRTYEKDEARASFVQSSLYVQRPDQVQNEEFTLGDHIASSEQFDTVSRQSFARGIGRGLVVKKK